MYPFTPTPTGKRSSPSLAARGPSPSRLPFLATSRLILSPLWPRSRLHLRPAPRPQGSDNWPIHDPRRWGMVHVDFNWNIPVTTMQYLGMDGLQITQVDEITRCIYRKRIMGHRF